MLKSIFLLFLVTFMMIGCESSESEPFHIDTQKPLTIYKGPINNTPVPINQKVYLEFSAPLNTNTINDTTAYMQDENNNSVGLYIGVGNPSSKIILTPYAFLEPSKLYTIVVTTGLQDVNGRSLSEDYRYEFTTQADSVDSTPLVVKSLKPEDGATDILVQSEIVIDFSKNLSLEPQYTNVEYLRVSDVNGTIAGKTEVFNSILKFIPDQPLPYAELISVELRNQVSDMFDNNFSDLASASWSFTTKTEVSSPKVNLGFMPFTSASLAKRSYLVRTVYNNTGESKIAVAGQDGIDIYLVEYGTTMQPTFTYLYNYPLASKINAMVSFLQGYLLVGTISGGVYTLKVDTTGVSQVGHYLDGENVQGLSLGYDGTTLDRAYAVGPLLGLQVFNLNVAQGTLAQANTTASSEFGQALDVVEATEYDTVAGEVLRKIYVADYNGSVVVCDENGTKLTQADLNTSVKRLAFNEDYNGKMSLLAIGSSGKMQGVGFDGSILSNVKLDLLSSIYDVKSFVDGNNMISNLYLSGGSSGILVTSGAYPNSIIDTGGRVVSSDIVTDSTNDLSYLVTLNEDGELQIFNALADTSSPYASTTPYNAETVSANGFSFLTEFFDNHLDTTTILKESFVFNDLNNSTLVPFTFDMSGSEYKLTPTSSLLPNTNYSVTISGEIADLMGNKLNSGVDTVVNFQINSDVILPSLTINDVSETEDNNITFTITLSETSTSNVTFDYATVGDTATDAVDYTSISGEGGILAGELSSTITIEVKDDYEAEGSEIFTLNLSNPSANAVIADFEGVGTIVDDVDTAEVGIFGSTNVNEGNNMSFTLAVNQRAITPLQINLSITHIETDSSDIVEPTEMSVTILATNNNTTFTIPTVDDTLSEQDESLKVEIISIDSVKNGGYENILIGGAYNTESTTTILDNDTGGSTEGYLFLSSINANEYDDFMEFRVQMEQPVTSDVTFKYTTQDVNTTAGIDYETMTGSAMIEAGNTSFILSVRILQDTVYEGDEQLKFIISDIVNATAPDGTEVTGTIIEDDPEQ